MDDQTPTASPSPASAPDAETISRALAAKRRSAMRKIMNGRALAKQGQDMEREGAAEMADVEAFERVYKGLPVTAEEIQALEHAAARLSSSSGRSIDLRLRNLAVHGGQGVDLSNLPLELRTELMHGSKTQRDTVIRYCLRFLSDGAWRTTDDLHELLNQAGVQLTAANPVQRISQILSTTDGFVSQRGRGWSLDRSPAIPDSLVSEQESEDPLRVQAKRVVDRDDHRAR